MSITESDLIRICLNRISYNYPDIPKIPESSAFDDAADAFSKIFGLAENDSSAFFARLNVLHNSISKANILYSAIEQIEDIPAQFPGELRRDSTGDHVRLLQTWLYGVSMFFPGVPAPELSGIFDSATENSLKGFQKVFSLPETGRADRISWNGLYRAFSSVFREELPTVPPFASDLKEGTSGETVRLLQQYINHIHTSLGYPPVLKETGRFGPITTKEVTALQTLLGLPADGIVNKNTWDIIGSLYLDTVIGEIKKPFQFPGHILSQELSF